MELNNLGALFLQKMLRRREVSAVEICQALYKRILANDGDIKAYLALNQRQAMQQAEIVDQAIAANQEVPPLAGLPLAIKDNICTKGLTTTCASKMLRSFVPPYNATVIEKLNANKAIIIGKTNLDEFAMGSSTENSAFYPTRNPWNREHVPGGSSGGSAAAVAAGFAIGALGSDTGGSIRQPAAFCGVVGLKPTYGLVSRFGLVAFASSLDQIGPLTRDVPDSALLLNAISGYDQRDSTSAPGLRPDYTRFLTTTSLAGVRVGLPVEYLNKLTNPAVYENLRSVAAVFEDEGATVEEVSLPHTEHSLPAYYLIAPAEASSNLARYDGVRYGHRTVDYTDINNMVAKSRSEGFGSEVKRRIMLGTYALSAGYYDDYYLKAQQVRTLIREDFSRAFKKYDVLLAPTTPDPAFPLGAKAEDPVQMYLSDIFTLACNLSGVPAMSIPSGFHEGLPLGVQLIGKPFDEGKLLQLGYIYQQRTNFHLKRPYLGGGTEHD